MQLVQVNHIRCGDYDGSTYLWVPDHWTQEKLDNEVYDAVGKYLNFLNERSIKYKPPVHTSYNIDGFIKQTETSDDVTIGEVKKQMAENIKINNKWLAEQSKTAEGFIAFMPEEVLPFYNGLEDKLETEAYWGHKHGSNINYDETLPKLGSTYPPAKNKTY